MTTNWKIERLDCNPSQDGLENVVYRVHWRLFGTVDQTSKSICGFVNLNSPDPNNFTAVDQLTKAEIMQWIGALIDTQAIEATLEQEINDIITPPTVFIKPNFDGA